jgi:hypothetical protein
MYILKQPLYEESLSLAVITKMIVKRRTGGGGEYKKEQQQEDPHTWQKDGYRQDEE